LKTRLGQLVPDFIRNLPKIPFESLIDMKPHPTLVLGLFSLSVSAQVFTTNSLPSQVGEYNCSYYSANVDTASLLMICTNAGSPPPPPPGGTSTVPQYWDFSQPQQSNETIMRTDIIAPASGPDGGDFPEAVYSEQDTMEPGSPFSWQYYGFTNSGPSPGRVYYGLYEPVDNASSLAQFIPPTTDIPSSVQYGQTWNRALSWETAYYEFIQVSNYFTASATVDAYGTIVLPGIGPLPALRVHEVHTYIVSELSYSPIPLDINTNQYYYWLVPGLGVAAQVYLFGNNILYPTELPNTNSFLRMYQASYFTNTPPPPATNGNLFIQAQNGSAFLTWDVFTNATNYRVDYLPSLVSTNWQTLGFTTSNSWSDLITSTQRFYRVVGIP
jgi:hypothetical protein